MPDSRVRLRLPDGSHVDLRPDAIIGRSSLAALRLEDPRLSSVHAELSWRPEGPLLLARGGRLLVEGRARAEVPLAPGLRITLVPGLELLVEDVVEGRAEPTAATLGREALTWRLGGAVVEASLASGASVLLRGLAARLVASCLVAPGARPWGEVAAELWPEEARVRAGQDPASRWTEEDERRLRNRWDQLLRALRRQLSPHGLDMRLWTGGGTVRLRLQPGDQMMGEQEPG